MTQKLDLNNFSAGEVGRQINVGLLGFKMAVNDSLTVFNLVDGVVDEFHDESGADEGEGSNDLYNATDDYYINSTQPDGSSLAFSAGFGITNITEEDTSEAGNNPDGGSGTFGVFTVPSGVTSIDMIAFGAGGGNGGPNTGAGAPGGYAEGTLAVTAGQTLYAYGGEGGNESGSDYNGVGVAKGGKSPNTTTSNQLGGGGGAAAGVVSYASYPQNSPPGVYLIAGGGGGSAILGPQTEFNTNGGGGGGGLTGNKGGPDGNSEGTPNAFAAGSNLEGSGGGGSQTAGGQGGEWAGAEAEGQTGSALAGGNSYNTGAGGGGGGWFGGGGGSAEPSGAVGGHGGGGSSYYGHPQVTSGATTDGKNLNHPDGVNQNSPQATYDGTNPAHTALNTLSPGLGKGSGANSDGPGNSGAVLITASAPATATSTTIVSNAFTANTAPSTSRIVVFQENINSVTLNTDIVASVSRNGGSNFTNVTLSDEGYITGSSGQRVLTGTVSIAGQPSGTAMRWKLALANNQGKIHGVSLSWA